MSFSCLAAPTSASWLTLHLNGACVCCCVLLAFVPRSITLCLTRVQIPLPHQASYVKSRLTARTRMCVRRGRVLFPWAKCQLMTAGWLLLFTEARQRKTKGGRKRAKKRECGIRSLQGAVVDEMRNFRLISEYVSFFKMVWCCLSNWLLYLFLCTQSSQLEPLLECNIVCPIVTFKHLQKMKVKVWIFAWTWLKQQANNR